MFEPMELTNDAVIKVIGVGGGGGNAVEHMVRERIEGVEFFAVNTDAQALRKTAVGQTIQIGSGITKGLGAGANPEVGRNSAEVPPSNTATLSAMMFLLFLLWLQLKLSQFSGNFTHVAGTLYQHQVICLQQLRQGFRHGVWIGNQNRIQLAAATDSAT